MVSVLLVLRAIKDTVAFSVLIIERKLCWSNGGVPRVLPWPASGGVRSLKPNVSSSQKNGQRPCVFFMFSLCSFYPSTYLSVFPVFFMSRPVWSIYLFLPFCHGDLFLSDTSRSPLVVRNESPASSKVGHGDCVISPSLSCCGRVGIGWDGMRRDDIECSYTAVICF